VPELSGEVLVNEKDLQMDKPMQILVGLYPLHDPFRKPLQMGRLWQILVAKALDSRHSDARRFQFVAYPLKSDVTPPS
jgi:hypothetical protein